MVPLFIHIHDLYYKGLSAIVSVHEDSISVARFDLVLALCANIYKNS